MLYQSERRPIGGLIIKILLLTAFVGLALLFIVSFTVKGKWEIEESVRVDVPAERIYPLVSSVRAWELWSVWNQVDHPGLEREFKGAADGVGSSVEWDIGMISGTTRVFGVANNKQVSFSISFDQRQANAEGRVVLRVTGEGTEVFMRLWGDAGTDPWEKLALLHYRPRLEREVSQSLTRLRDKIEARYAEEQSGTTAP